MGERVLPQTAVFRATVWFAVLALIPHGHSTDCSQCYFKEDPMSSNIELFVGNSTICSVYNASFTTTSQNSITVTGLLPGNSYLLKTNCSNDCCGNFSTSSFSNFTFTQLNYSSMYINWTDKLPQGSQSFALRPESVTNLTVTSITPTSLVLSWSLPTGFSLFYRITVDTIQFLTTNQTSILISDLIPGTKYTFSVTPVASDNRTEGHMTQISQNTSPAQVENITVLNSNSNSVTVEWSVPLGNVDKYMLNLSDRSVYISTNMSVISNLTAGCLFNLTITSISGVLSSVSNIFTIATNPNPPEALSVSGQTDTSISLLWSKPLSMDGVVVSFEVSYRHNTSAVELTLNQTNFLNVNLTNLSSGSQYDFTVATKGVKDLRSINKTLTAYTVPDAVQNLTVSNVNISSVSLSWLPPKGSSTLFSYSINISSTLLPLNPTSKNSYQITQLQPGTQYNCSVRTLVVAGNISGTLKSIECNTKPLPVTNLTASPVGTTGMYLSWSHQSLNKSLYQYNVSVNGESWLLINSEGANVSNLTPGSNYSFAVQTVMNRISSDPVVISAFTGLGKASSISLVSTTQSMRVEWKSPAGVGLLFTVKMFLMDGTILKTMNQTNETSVVFTDLLPGTQYSFIVTCISGPIKQDSDNVSNATFPTPPGEMTIVSHTTLLNISWPQPLNMSSVLYFFFLEYSNSTLPAQSVNCSQNYTSLTGLSAGVPYIITLRTVAALGYLSTPQFITAYTNPSPVTNARVDGFTEISLTLSWQQIDGQQTGYLYLLTFTHPNGTADQKSVSNTTVQLLPLQSASQYNITIVTKTADGTLSDPQIVTACTKPFPVQNVVSEVLNVSAVSLIWARPQEYLSGISYQVLVSNCTKNVMNLSTSSENITIGNLEPGTWCQFSLYSLACSILGKPVNIPVLTRPSIAVPRVVNQSSNHSLLVTWEHPVGGLDLYILNISCDGWTNSTVLNSTERSYTFTQLKAATLFKVTLTTVKGSFQETSHSVNMATYPNRPGMINVLFKSNHSVMLHWGEAQGMTPGSFNYTLSFWPNYSNTLDPTPNNTVLLDGLRSGTSYNVTLATVGPMGFKSETIQYSVTTKPDPVRNLKVNSTTTRTFSLVWDRVDGVPKYIVSVSYKTEERSITIPNSQTIDNLLPSTQYNISVQSSTADDTEGDVMWLLACTDAATVENVVCVGPNLTAAMLKLSWGLPHGGNQGFEVKLGSSGSTQTNNLNYSFTDLEYNTQYSVTIWTRGCGKRSTEKMILCKTGFTSPIRPKTTGVSVSERQYNRFTLVIQLDAFSDTKGIVLYYGVLVSSVSFDCMEQSSKCLLSTYDDWKAKRSNSFLAVVKSTGSRSVQGQTVMIGDQTQWNNYTNGELNAKGSYSFALVAFTHLELKKGLVDVTNSYFSISDFDQSLITLPENPGVIGGAAAGVGVAAIVVMIIIVGVVCKRKHKKDESNSVPIHSIRNKVSDPVKIEDYEAYYRRQRADSFCGFAEEFEDLRPVGINQSKAIALAPENKTKNRYNNVLPYDYSRVKLSVLNSPCDDYINASYMPGYISKKEFIAAQGPLPCTVNDFWRMMWEKNIHTIVMLTKCNEQGRVKCEQYWPAETKLFHNLMVTNISEITMEDWTLRDFEVKNLKTAEARSVRHFHFTAWPDHGVPETTDLLINFRHLVREHMEQYSRHSPTLVHCSAGVGRTGTFIAIDRLIFQIERDGVVDVFGVIHDLRLHRPLMVQTEDQYVFLNQCAMDIIRSRTGNNVDLIYQNTAALTVYENFEPLKKPKNGYH